MGLHSKCQYNTHTHTYIVIITFPTHSQNPWLIELSGMCYDPRMSPNTAQNALRAGQEACSILVSFCNVLPNVLCSDSMMCELIDGEPNPYSFGKFNSRLRYEEGEPNSNHHVCGCYPLCTDFNGKGFVGNLFDGTKTNKCPDGLSAAINFVCDPKAVWDSDNITKFVVAKPNYIDCQVSSVSSLQLLSTADYVYYSFS